MRKTKLRKILDERGLSAYALANSIGMNPRTLQVIAAGTSKPTLTTAMKIAHGLKIDVSKLF
jgi:DNA-binding XRE family transcriptional regulator